MTLFSRARQSLQGNANGRMRHSRRRREDDRASRARRISPLLAVTELENRQLLSLPGDAPVDLTTLSASKVGPINGAFFSNAQYNAGTGVIDPFVRVQANGTEQGYNSGADYKGTTTLPNPQFNETNSYDSQYNHALALKDIPIAYVYNPTTRTFDGYYEFRLDINENDTGLKGDQYPGPAHTNMLARQ